MCCFTLAVSLLLSLNVTSLMFVRYAYLEMSVSDSPSGVMVLFRENSGGRPDVGNSSFSELAAVKKERNCNKSLRRRKSC